MCVSINLLHLYLFKLSYSIEKLTSLLTHKLSAFTEKKMKKMCESLRRFCVYEDTRSSRWYFR